VLAEPFHLDDYEVQLDASVGIALHRPEYETAAEMLRDADIAVGAAKKNPDRHQVFDGMMHEEALERLEIEVDLRRGLKRDELVVHYQPIVRADDQTLVGFEALVRWQHPTRGFLGPGKFLGVAEDSGLIVELGRWVLERSCRDLHDLQAAWRGEEPLHVSVNMSAKQFLHAECEPHLHRCLEESGTPPEQVWIEITETTVLDTPKDAEERITRLNELGVKVCVDDFGVGYSALGYLQRLSFSVLKLDRAFVKEGPRNEAIVRAVTTLAQGLGMTVVAEGIETQEQLDLVTRLGSPLAQGFLFARPVPLEEACSLARLGHFRSTEAASSRLH
jgi:EAL domain-containing protein (putative c-di-GMP-specific phosphodiesterase class I)